MSKTALPLPPVSHLASVLWGAISGSPSGVNGGQRWGLSRSQGIPRGQPCHARRPRPRAGVDTVGCSQGTAAGAARTSALRLTPSQSPPVRGVLLTYPILLPPRCTTLAVLNSQGCVATAAVKTRVGLHMMRRTSWRESCLTHAGLKPDQKQALTTVMRP